jgi:uncharacterized membrane protein YphA (DoxX/SURF4 family)
MLGIPVDVELAGRWVLALVFVTAGLTKILSHGSERRRSEVRNYGVLPEILVTLAASTLPWFEITLGVLLAAGIAVVAVTGCAAAILIAFATVVGWHLRRGDEFGCGCGVGDRAISWRLVRRNIGLAGVAVAAATGPAGMSVWPGWGASSAAASGSHLIPIPMLVILVAVTGRLVARTASSWRHPPIETRGL